MVTSAATNSAHHTGASASPMDHFPLNTALTQRFTLGAPRAFWPSPAGVWFLRAGGLDDTQQSLWLLQPGQEEPTRVLSPAQLGAAAADADLPEAERARRERLREAAAGVTSFSVSSSGLRLVGTAGSALWQLDVTSTTPLTWTLHPVPEGSGAVDPQLSPDGNTLVWVYERAMRTSQWDPTHESWGTARTLLAPETPHESYGLADFAAAEELGRMRGFWFAPDRAELLVAHVDESPIQPHWLSDPTFPEQPPRELRYPRAGAANATVRLLRVSLTQEFAPVSLEWDRDQFPYLAAVRWQAKHPALVTVLSRDQRTRHTYALAEDSLHIILKEHAAQWLDADPSFPRWSPSGNLLILVAELDTNTHRLALATPSSSAPSLRMLTPTGLQVQQLVSTTTTEVLFAGSTSPGTQQLYRVDWQGAHCVPLATPPHWEQTAAQWQVGTSGAQTIVRTQHLLTRETPLVTVTWPDGTHQDMAHTGPTSGLTLNSELTHLGERQLHTLILWPQGWQGAGKLPVLFHPYGGPGHARVTHSGRQFLEDQWLANQGFAVVIVDGAGSPGRGPVFERELLGDLAGPPLADQVHAWQALRQTHADWLDFSRVGILGWSFGGYLAALAALAHPDKWHAALAGAPVTDWALYDTAYTERYLGTPQEQPQAYEIGKLETWLKRQQQRPEQEPDVSKRAASATPATSRPAPILCIHGFADDNVLPAHTLQFSEQLLAAGYPHEVLPLPGASHMASQATIREQLLRLQARWFQEKLRMHP